MYVYKKNFKNSQNSGIFETPRSMYTKYNTILLHTILFYINTIFRGLKFLNRGHIQVWAKIS